MSDPSKTDRVVVDESALDSLFGPEPKEKTPAVKPSAAAENSPGLDNSRSTPGTEPALPVPAVARDGAPKLVSGDPALDFSTLVDRLVGDEARTTPEEPPEKVPAATRDSASKPVADEPVTGPGVLVRQTVGDETKTASEEPPEKAPVPTATVSVPAPEAPVATRDNALKPVSDEPVTGPGVLVRQTVGDETKTASEEPPEKAPVPTATVSVPAPEAPVATRDNALKPVSDEPVTGPGVLVRQTVGDEAKTAPEEPPEEAADPAAQAAPAGDPDDPVWRHAAGNRQLSAGDYTAAEKSYRAVLESDPESWSARFNLGVTLGRLGRDEECLAEYRKAQRIDGARVEALLASGFVQLRLGEYRDALESFVSVLTKQPDISGALFGKGAALQALEKFGEAKECYKGLLKDHPKSEDLLGNLAVTSLALKDYPRAKEYAEMLAESSEEPERSVRLLVECAIGQSDEEATAQLSAQLVEMAEESYEAWFNLGVACQHTGRLEVAVDAYKQALAVESERPEAQVNLGAVLHESENLPEARQFYEAALRSGDADHPGVNWNLALALESVSALDEAEKAYASVVRSQPHWKEAVSRLDRLNPARGNAQG